MASLWYGDHQRLSGVLHDHHRAAGYRVAQGRQTQPLPHLPAYPLFQGSGKPPLTKSDGLCAGGGPASFGRGGWRGRGRVWPGVFPGADPERLRRLIVGAPGRPPQCGCHACLQSPGCCRLFTDGASRGNPGKPVPERCCWERMVRSWRPEPNIWASVPTTSPSTGRSCWDWMRPWRGVVSSWPYSMDSELIVRQIQGKYKVKTDLLPLYAQVQQRLARLRN